MAPDGDASYVNDPLCESKELVLPLGGCVDDARSPLSKHFVDVLVGQLRDVPPPVRHYVHLHVAA